MHSAPLLDAPHLLTFCAEIAHTSQPLLVTCRPQLDRPAKECFSIVEEQISLAGGSMAVGWAIWERPGVFIEAEFHSVWVSPNGDLVDITPRPLHFFDIVFLPVPSLRYEGRQVDNIRKPLVHDKDLLRFLFIFTRRFQILNEGDLAYQHGAISLAPRAMKELRALDKEGARLDQRLRIRYETDKSQLG